MLDTLGNTITYFGHSTFSLTTPSGTVAMIDPWVMNNPRCPKELKNVERLDVIFATHGHSDHIGDLVELGKKHKPEIVAIFELAMWLGKKGLGKSIRPMSKGGTQTVGEFSVTMTHAFHSSSVEDGDDMLYAGEAAGLIIRMPGGFTVYHAGDTAVFGDMKLIGDLYQPDVAMLPIGDNFTMGPREAALAVKFLGVKEVIPMHYATFPQLTGTPEEFRNQCPGNVAVHILQPGESLGGTKSAKGAN
jgi:L-ascorbate metabolism protein UlaG (beta-lactamase superfamily)